jgi:transcriptional regulator GlxA family with amidase domain
LRNEVVQFVGVAAETDFFDQSHFTQQLKRHSLVTPGSHRTTARLS